MSDPKVELEFSKKYDREMAEQYYRKHTQGLGRRLSHWRDVQIVQQALEMAGRPLSVLDLPCGAGRFWPVLAKHDSRTIMAADNSEEMIAIAKMMQPPRVVKRVNAFQTSAFDIQLPAEAVECILCVRLIHHIADAEHRLKVLKEFHRVTQKTVIFSLWVDGNYKAKRRVAVEQRKAFSDGTRKSHDRFLISRSTIEAEIVASGYKIIGYIDFIPHYAMWRYYVLQKI